jgi:hypothetical protein
MFAELKISITFATTKQKTNQRITNTDISLTRCLHIIYLKPNKLKLMKKSLLLMGMAVAAMTASAQETMTPLTVISGWQADVFCENSPVKDYLKLGVDNGSVGFFTKHFRDVPETHPITSETSPTSNLGHVYSIDATKDNALQLCDISGNNAFPESPTLSGILNLKTPQAFDELYLLGTCGNGPAAVDVVYTYDDGTTSTEKISIFDWWNTTTDHTMDGFYGLDRINRLDISDRSNTTAVRLQEVKLSPTAGKVVTSIEFDSETTGDCVCNIFGLSSGTAGVEITDGFNVDLIAESLDANGQVTGTTTSGIDKNGYVIYTDKLDLSSEKDYTYGVPMDGLIQANSGTTFQLADYAHLNATRLAKDETVAEIGDMTTTTIQFQQTVKASELHILATAGNGPAHVAVTYLYSDGTSQDGDSFDNNTGGFDSNAATLSTTMDVMDWCNNHGYQVYTTGRYYGGASDGDYAGFYEYIGYPDDTKELTGVTLTNTLSDNTGNSKAIIVAFTAKGTVVTGINAIDAAKTATDSKIFNLAGQQVSKSYKGIVIKNGQKMIQK